MEYLNTSELIQYAKLHIGSFLLLAGVLLFSFLLAVFLGRVFLKLMDAHLGSSVWLEEYEFTLHKAFIIITTIVFTLLIAGSTDIFAQLSWILAPLAIVIVYTSRKTLQNITEYLFLLMEGKILEGQYITLREEEMHHKTSGKITQVDSRKCFLKTFSGGEIMVMHHNIFEGIVTNYTKSQIRRITISFTLPLSYSFTDIEREAEALFSDKSYILQQYPKDVLLIRISQGLYHVRIHCWIDSSVKGLFASKKLLTKDLALLLQEKFPVHSGPSIKVHSLS